MAQEKDWGNPMEISIFDMEKIAQLLTTFVQESIEKLLTKDQCKETSDN